MAHSENLKETFRILRKIIKPEDHSGMRQIDIPTRDQSRNIITRVDGSTKMTTLSDPTKVENAIIDRNIKHFGQAEGTAFTTRDLIMIFGIDGDSQATDNLIQGN
jgi:hypothetical protein